jgi:hypothetical protein
LLESSEISTGRTPAGGRIVIRAFTIRRALPHLFVWMAYLGYAAGAHGHGSVVAEEDLCVIKIGFYTAHFTIYQPRQHGHREFCEDLPEAAETVFVMDYLHDSMREVAVDFRVVVDRNGIGRFADYEDVEALDLDRDTVFYQPPVRQADAVFTVLHEFLEPGGYIGVVTADNPNGDRTYRAVFPFQVGGISPVLWLVLAAALLAVAAGGWMLNRRRPS